VSDRLVGDRELAQVVTQHLGLDFDGGERLAVVDANDAANHLGHDNGVAQMRLHDLGLAVVDGGLLFRLAQLLEQRHLLALQTARRETTSRARVEQLDVLLVAHLKQVGQVDATERELFECASLRRRRDEALFALLHHLINR